MIIVSYDIKDDKLRGKFCRYLKKFGYRLQYSVFEITNSKRMLGVIMSEVTNRYEKLFSQEDSVIIIETGESCKISRWGYARNEESDIIVVG
ncbi:MAG: CRISPR-associated endonuclease Cas2 [Synergistes sp.]|nr:CRISPR-associated endonuclease Cas2 [Synergistes sp.]